MDLQKQWCYILQPTMAMLKFRLPWTSGCTEYYAGDIYTQPRVGPVSTEMRLWTDCKKIIKYDHDDYNNRCYYFNKCVRDAIHDLPENKLPENKLPKNKLFLEGIDHCYDCWSEINIITKAIELKIWDKPINKILEDIAKYTYSILTMPPHNLLYSEKNISNKNLWQKVVAMKDIITNFRLHKAAAKAEKFRKNKNRKLNTFQIVIYDYYNKLLKVPKFDYIQPTTELLNKFIKCDTPYYNIMLTNNIPEAKYIKLEQWQKIATPAAQRSKLLMIIEFLSKYGQTDNTVIIFTTKIGSYIAKLCKMFNTIKFRVYINSPEDTNFITAPNLTIINKLFTYEAAAEETTGNLFIYDAYFKSKSGVPQIEVNNKVYDIQINLCKILKPRMAMLIYFIMSSKCEFYTGDLYIPPWKRQLSGILRLITDCTNIKKYDCEKIDKQIFYFDICMRMQWYDHNIKGAGIDHCYDCWREINIWLQYFKYINYPHTDTHIYNRMLHPTNALHSSIQLPPHGLLAKERDYRKRIIMLTNYTLYRQAIFTSIGKKFDEVKINPTINTVLFIEDYDKKK